MPERIITIFLSTPSDVVSERATLMSLVSEVNDVVAFLAPERNIKLKVLYYANDAYPNVGGDAQQVINQQMNVDYDIYFGIMWRRCGTPTERAASGTVEEFNRALERRQKTGRPTIMFFFSNENIGIPWSDDEFEQLKQVVLFRRRIEAIGLTVVYPSPAEFRERARIGLLRAVADLLKEELPRREASAVTTTPVPDRLEALANEYERLRRDLPSGDERTQKMEKIVDLMKAEASAAKNSLAALVDDASAGRRLAAIAILQVFPTRDYVSWLADRLNPALEKPFVGYQATIALLQAVRSLPSSEGEFLKREVSRARELAMKNPTDAPRITALDYALQELKLKSS